MSDLAAVITAWAAAHLVVSLHNLAIHLRRKTDFEYLAFAVMALGFAIYTFGAALVTDATSTAEGTTAMRISYVGAPLALGGFISFAAVLQNKHASPVVRLAIAWSALGLVASLAGLFFDPDTPALSSPYTEPQQTVVAIAWTAGACGFIAWTLFHVLKSSRRDRDIALLGWGALLIVAAAIHDQAVHFFSAPGPYFLEHAALGVNMLLSYMLLRRLAGTERELERRTREVEASYRDLKRAQDDLIDKEQLAAVGELSAVIAHEIRNPLAILRNAASGLRRHALPPSDEKTLLSILDEEADRLGRLSIDLATYARPLSPRKEVVQIRDLVRDCMASVLNEAAGDALSVEAALDEGPNRVIGDPVLLNLALTNVIDNAVQAMPAGGELVVRTKAGHIADSDAITIEVADTGEGMNTLVREKALDPFFTTRASGSGLGLAIVDRIVRAHGGSVRIESRYGKGTILKITLPAERP